jgi:hypothetical protein
MERLATLNELPDDDGLYDGGWCTMLIQGDHVTISCKGCAGSFHVTKSALSGPLNFEHRQPCEVNDLMHMAELGLLDDDNDFGVMH